ncbi:MAG: dockerin type I domain-containing protein [Haloarculaceae archaeon]
MFDADTHPDAAEALYERLRSFAVAVTAALVVTAALTGAGALAASGPAAAQESAGYTVSVEFPENFTTDGRQTVQVSVENTADSALFNPVVEVPLPNGLTVDGTSVGSARVRFPNGTTEARTAELDTSTFRSGQSLFINGEEVPANTAYTYEFDVGVPSTGNESVEAEVRPLYNTDLSARDSSTAYAAGFGTLDVTVQRPDGSPVAGADVLIDGESVGAGATSVVEGNHTVVVDGTSVVLPTFERTVDVGETVRLTYTVPATLADPTVVATDRGASVIEGSAGELERTATASRAAAYDLSFVVDASGGRTTVAFPTPSSGAVPASELDELTATTDSGSVSLERFDDSLRANVSAETDATVTVSYDGERLGDVSGDGSVDRGDAGAVAGAVASGSDAGAYADVNDDGDVNAVDAMLVAQYANGERDDSYALSGGD